jgi:hypothetical protein
MAQYRAVFKQFYQATKSTEATWPFVGPMLALCGALLWGSAMVYASMYARLPLGHPSVKTFVIGLGAVAGLFIACGAFGSAKRHILLWPLIFVGGLLAGGYCVLHFGVDGVTRMNEQAHQAFVDERSDFANSPAGFPYLATTAHNAWKTDVELNDVDVQAAGEAPSDSDGSPATVEIHAGFCVMNLTPRTLERSVGAAEDAEYRQDALWVAVARQVGRCVDVARDESGAPVPGMSFKSLAPVDAFGISNSHDYFVATKKATTRQWRDGFADAFAVGWMRLAKPSYARQLADTLQHERELNASDDMGPRTGCSIGPAMQSAMPASLEDLPAWADRVRASACPR